MKASKKRKLPPLLAASQSGYYCKPEVVRALLAASEDVHVRDTDGSTALHALLTNRDPMCVDYKREEECLRILLQAGADPNAADEMGRTPLHLFGDAGAQDGYVTCSIPVLRLLLEAGANPNAVDARGETPLHILARWDDAAEIGEDDWGPEAERNSSSLAPMLLEAGASVDIVSRAGKTPLAIAVEEQCGAMAKLLRSHGASTTLLSDTHALFVAAMEDDVEAATRLLDAGVDPGVRVGWHHWDRTVLHEAATHGATGVIRLLLERGADPNATNTNDGYTTAAKVAADRNQVEALRTLLECAPDQDHKPLIGACVYAADAGRWEVANTLVSAGVPLTLRSAASLGDVSVLEEMTASFDRNDWPQLSTAIDLAAKQGRLMAVRFLLMVCRRINVPARYKEFPFRKASQLARQGGHTEVSELIASEWESVKYLSP